MDRFEADSKFFRTFLAILPLLLLWQVIRLLAAPAEFVAALESVRMADIHRMAVLGLVGTVIFGFAAWRYFERRLKSTTQAYWFLITLECVRGDEGLAKRKPGEPTHAGGIVVKRVRGDVQVLLVKAKASEKWVLPKGHIEPGESAAEAAVREVQEETGVWARVHDELGTAHFAAGTEAVEVKFFLMEFLEESKEPAARPRQRSWLPQPTIERRETDWRSLDGAWELPDLPESSALLDEARRRFKAPKVRPSPARPAPSPQSSRRPAP